MKRRTQMPRKIVRSRTLKISSKTNMRNRKYCKDLPSSSSSSKKQEELLQTYAKAIEENNISKLFQICFNLVDINNLFEYKSSSGTKEKTTLLHIAVDKENKDAISLLTHNNGDATIKNSLGISAEAMALINNKIEILELLQMT